MKRPALLLAAMLFAVVAIPLMFADDANAFGHRRARHSACAGVEAASCSGYEGWYWGKNRDERVANRHDRKASRHASYGCSEPAAASCSEPGGYSGPPAVSYEATEPQVCVDGICTTAPTTVEAPPAPPAPPRVPQKRDEM